MPDAIFRDRVTMIGTKEVGFEKVLVQSKFRMYMPKSFQEDANMAYRYAFFSNKAESPLSIAIRFTPVSDAVAREKMIANYFGSDKTTENVTGANNIRILYRESVNSGSFLSVYTMRFAIEMEGGTLFGCFNCSSEFTEDWRPVVLAMLQSIERV